jgi:hypothetical protein
MQMPSDLDAFSLPSALAKPRRYDRVLLPAPGGAQKELSRRQYENLPLRERVALLLSGTATFYCGSEQIPTIEAMKN